MYLQTDVDIRSMVRKLTNGVYDKQSKQNVFTLYYIQLSDTVTLGPRDPDFVMPVVKSLFCKCRKLRRQGTGVEVDALCQSQLCIKFIHIDTIKCFGDKCIDI